MIIVYDSKTGNVDRFINKIKHNLPHLFCIPIDEYHSELGPYHLITHTTNFGKVSNKVGELLYYSMEAEENYVNLLSISSSGNRNWGKNFAVAADLIQDKAYDYGVTPPPIFLKFELSGTVNDVKTYINKLQNYGKQMDSSQ